MRANVILQHGTDCKLVGKKVESHNPGNKTSGKAVTNSYKGGEYAGRSTVGHASEDGTESVDAWECSTNCPVRTLDEQSGNRPGMSGGGTHKKDYGGGMFGGIDSTSTARNDSGGASRFFNQFKPDLEAPPFFYTGKITFSERKEASTVNDHPTVKSKTLMAHLVRLVTPPKGRVLDPFAGSGSTIVAAIEGGFSGVGIEKEPHYHDIASARVTRVLDVKNQKSSLQDFLSSMEE